MKRLSSGASLLTAFLLCCCSQGNGNDPTDGSVSDSGPDGDQGDAGNDATGDADSDAPSPDVPEWEPGLLDPSFEVEGLDGFYLIGNALTPGGDLLELTVRGPESTSRVDVWVNERYAGQAVADDDTFSAEASIADLGPGEHTVILAADESARAFAALTFIRSHPIYIVMTNDWDDPDNGDVTFRNQEDLRAWHPDLRLTHFVGPYTFTDPTVTEERRDFIVSWLLSQRDEYEDEIGLHIHPYCTFVEHAGLTCRTDRSFAYADGDETGYTVFLGVYDEEETVLLFETADEIFTGRGLGKPISFRAGGWTAESHTFRAMERTGYVADTSGANWSRMEEWEGVPGTELYDWNREHWATIDETSQPYYPNRDDVLSTEPPLVQVLEVPDNGLLVDYVTGEEMIEMFQANWNGGALEEPRQYSIGYHPPNFSRSLMYRLDDALTHIDLYLASNGEGPVVYATLSELVQVWPFEGE